MKKITMLISAVVLTLVLSLGVGEVTNNAEVNTAKSENEIMMLHDPMVDGVG